MRMRFPGRAVIAVATATVALAGAVAAGPGEAATADLTPAALHVSANHLLTPTGQVVVLRGVNRSSPETNCESPGLTSFFAGPTDDASAAAIASWHANFVRIPINEDCWLGRNGLPASLSASDYRNQLSGYARLLVKHGLYVLMDLHFAEVNGQASTTFAPMADAAYGPVVWKSIAATFKGIPDVMFDLYNEPHGVSWSCWRNGCTDAATRTVYAGMNQLISAVRSTGAHQPVFVSGLNWANDMSSWLANQPTDSARQVVAAAHVYMSSGCVQLTCVNTYWAPLALKVPFVITEFGDDNTGELLSDVPAWAGPLGVGYAAFTWNVPSDPTAVGYHLISSWDGTPTWTGALLQAQLLGA